MARAATLTGCRTLTNLPDVKVTHELLTLVRSRYPLVAVQTHEEARLERILADVASQLGVPLWTWDAGEGLVHLGTGNAMYNTSRADQVLFHLKRSAEDGLYLLKDLHHHLKDPGIQRALRTAAEKFRQSDRAIFMVAPSFDLPPELEKAVMVVPLPLPGPEELKAVIYRAARSMGSGRAVKIRMNRGEMTRLLGALRGLTLEEAERAVVQVVLEDRELSAEDIPRVLEVKQKALMRGGVLEFVPTAESLDDVAGMANLKKWLDRRQHAFDPRARDFGLEVPRGMLLLGVQGCGKSLLAKSVARSWDLPLLRLDPGALYDKFVGESERKLREAIVQAEAMAPAVLWIDEIEKGLAGASTSEVDGGLSRRIFATFISWLQEKREAVFVVATANDISALPPELVRKGRFDEIFFVDLPGPEAREAIFRIHLRRRDRDSGDFDLAALVAASEGFSGAEIEQAVVGALYSAFSGSDTLQTEHVLNELAGTRPLSVTMAEKVAELRAWARDRTVPAD
ncbi:AAA family ATPase [Gemmatimonadota bacterium]